MTRYSVRITPDDVGSRVSLRLRTHGDPPLTDVVGLLRSWTSGVLSVERRNGTTVTVPADDLVAGKVLPPPPTRSGH